MCSISQIDNEPKSMIGCFWVFGEVEGGLALEEDFLVREEPCSHNVHRHITRRVTKPSTVNYWAV